MINNGLIGVPVGGVIPWVGDAYGVALPENFAKLDNLIDTDIPIESPFYGLTDLLPNMSDQTFHCVEGEVNVGNPEGIDKVTLSLTKGQLPTDYGFKCEEGSYLSVSNYDFDSGITSATFSTYAMLSSSQYFGASSISLENAGVFIGGSGAGYLEYSPSAIPYNDGVSHRHYADASHSHSISATSYTSKSTQNKDWGTIGGSKDIVLGTKIDNLSRASCYFAIRLW